MIWIATYKDGTILRQYEVGSKMSSADLDREQLSTFRITETGGDMAVKFSSDSGILKFNNLDYEKIQALTGKEKLSFTYDKDNECFKLDAKSLKLINKIVLKDEKDYFYIEFDQTGVFYVNGQPFYMGYMIDGEEMPFINQPPYKDFTYIVDANEDFYTNTGTAYKKASYETAHSITLNKTHTFGEIEFNALYKITFDVLKGYVLLDCTLQCNKEVNGNAFMIMGGERTSNPVPFMANEKKQFRRILTML